MSSKIKRTVWENKKKAQVHIGENSTCAKIRSPFKEKRNGQEIILDTVYCSTKASDMKPFFPLKGGDRIFHPRFGDGVVLGVAPSIQEGKYVKREYPSDMETEHETKKLWVLFDEDVGASFWSLSSNYNEIMKSGMQRYDQNVFVGGKVLQKKQRKNKKKEKFQL